MKTKLLKIATVITVALTLCSAASAMEDMKMDGDKSGRMGQFIHTSTVDGYKLDYHLIDNKAQMEKMEDMKGMSMAEGGAEQMKSHHLMVYITNPDGKMIEDAKVGYLVVDPAGAKQKAMAMGMKGGLGADVEMKAKGEYTVNVKIVAGDAKVIDKITYEVK